MAIGDVWRMTILGEVVGQQQQNVLHYQTLIPRDGDDDDLPALILIAQEYVAPLYEPITTAEWILREIQIRGVTHPTQGADVVIDQPGVNVGQLLPLQSAPVLSLKTGLIGRSYRGRLYLPTITEDNAQAGVIEEPFYTTLGTFGTNLLQIQRPGGQPYTAGLVVWSRKLQTATRVISAAPDPILGVMRKRRQGVGI